MKLRQQPYLNGPIWDRKLFLCPAQERHQYAAPGRGLLHEEFQGQMYPPAGLRERLGWQRPYGMEVQVPFHAAVQREV